jgi:hypothetical protein
MNQKCVYCGARWAKSRDHIPPRCLFKKPRPNLITVPSCEECNHSASQDDEYLRLILSLRHDAHEHSDVHEVWPTVRKSLKRSEAMGFRRSLIKTIRIAELRTNAGLHIGKAAVYDADLSRLNRVVERIMKGLFFYHRGKRLPDDLRANVYALDGFTQSDVEVAECFVRFYQFVHEAELHVIGENVFSYRMRFLSDVPDAGIFFCTFYNAMSFIGGFGASENKA